MTTTFDEGSCAPSPGRRVLVGLLLAAAAAVLFGVWTAVAGTDAAAAQSSGGSPEQKIDIINFDFRQRVVEVPAGTTITWTNTSARPHTATDRGGTFDTGALLPGRSASVTLSAPGSYFYFCRINPKQMNGVITVAGDTVAVPVVRMQAVDGQNLAEAEGGLRFDPKELTVSVGTKIAVANVGGLRHTMTLEDGSLTTPVIPPGPEQGRFAGTTAEITVTKAGTFPFRCDIHPNAMKGVLTVVETGGAVPPTTAAPPAETAPPTTAPPVSSTAAQTRPPPTTASAAAAVAPPASVNIIDFAFEPEAISVAPGAEITFANTGVAPHTATFDDIADLDTGTLEAGGTKSLKAPSQPGSYSFHCEIHPRMTAVLQVQGGSDSSAGAATTTAADAVAETTLAASETTVKEAGAPIEVGIVDFGFEPDTLTVASGAAITFANTGVAPHTATVLGGKGFDTGTLEAGSAATVNAPDEPGTYPYRCEIHPGRMTGTIIVESSPDATPDTAEVTTAPASAPGSSAAPAITSTAAPPGTASAPGASGSVTALAVATGLIGLGLGAVGIVALARKRRS